MPVVAPGRRSSCIAAGRAARAAPPGAVAPGLPPPPGRRPGSAVRAALALRRLDPDDPALDERYVRRRGSTAHGQSPAGDRPPLGPDRPSRRSTSPRGGRVAGASPRWCSAPGCSPTAAAADIGWARVPLAERCTGTRPRAPFAAAGASIRTDAPVEGIERGPTARSAVSTSTTGTSSPTPSCSPSPTTPPPRCCRRRGAGLGPPSRARRIADRQRAPRLRPPGDRPPAGRRGRHAGAVRVRPHRGVRHRARVSASRSRCPPPTSRSAGPPPSSCAESSTPLSELFPPARAARVRRHRRDPGARGDVPGRARDPARCGPGARTARARPVPRRGVDRHRMARHDGGRGAQRHAAAAAVLADLGTAPEATARGARSATEPVVA